VVGDDFGVGEVLGARFLQLIQHIVEQGTVALPDLLKLHTRGAVFGRIFHVPSQCDADVAHI
jgi:hypothetical protein